MGSSAISERNRRSASCAIFSEAVRSSSLDLEHPVSKTPHGSVKANYGKYHREHGNFIGTNCAVPNKNVVSKIEAMTEEELKAEVERLKAENEALKSPARGQLSLKVSEKGAVSVYGLGRFPVTLYKEQWAKLLGMADQIKEFITKNDHLLKKKE